MLIPGLYPFFHRHLQQGFGEYGLDQPALVDYVSDLLTRFVRVNSLYALRDADGRPIETMAGFLLAQQTAINDPPTARAPVRETLVLRHMADYALFMSGLFRERLKHRGQIGYYREHGRNAFARCARLEANPNRARLLHRMGHDFEPISDALDVVWHRRLPFSATDTTSPLAALWHA